MRILKALTIFILIFGLHFQAFATNTNSADFELDSSQYLSIADGSQTGLDMTTDFSVEAWIKFETLPSTLGTQVEIASKMIADTGTGGWQFYFTAADELRVYWFEDAGSTYGLFTSTAAAVDETAVWHHYAVTVDVDGNAIFYVDGSAVATTDNGGAATSIIGSTADFRIGSYELNGGGADAYMDGRMDDIRVWSDIRTPTEIDDNMSIEDPAGDALEGYWKVNDSLLDETANDNDLTNNNTVTFPEDPAFSAAAAAINNEQIILFE